MPVRGLSRPNYLRRAKKHCHFDKAQFEMTSISLDFLSSSSSTATSADDFMNLPTDLGFRSDAYVFIVLFVSQSTLQYMVACPPLS